MADRIPPDLAQRKSIEGHLGYLRKREPLMQYPAFRREGWPIGSGMVESAKKLVVQARLKGPGMRFRKAKREFHAGAAPGRLQWAVAGDVAKSLPKGT